MPGRDPDEAGDDVEEAVALAELERRLEDRPVEVRTRGRAPRPSPSSSRSGGPGRRSTPSAPMWTSRRTPAALHRGDDGARALGVDQAQVGAAVEVARDGHEMDDRVDARQRRSRASSGRVTSPIRISTLARVRGAAAGRGRSRRRSASGTSATTRWPAASRAGTVWLPTKPLAPVTRMVDMRAWRIPVCMRRPES